MKKIFFLTILFTILSLKLSHQVKSSRMIEVDEIDIKKTKTIDGKLKILYEKINDYLKSIKIPGYDTEFPLNTMRQDFAFIRKTQELGYAQFSITYIFNPIYKPSTLKWREINKCFPYTIEFYNGYIEQYRSGELIKITHFKNINSSENNNHF